MPARHLAPLLALLAGCGGQTPLNVWVEPGLHPALEAHLATVPYERLRVESADAPTNRGGRGLHIAVTQDLQGCTECYRLEGDGRRYQVQADGPLGAMYGVADLMEQLGFAFLHPYHTITPDRLRPIEEPRRFGEVIEPQMTRRGLHMHTLHPIEGLFDFWIPGDRNLEGARQVMDWTIRHRGNHVQWVALDDIVRSSISHEAWRDHTRAIVQDAHLRGLTVGVGLQLFGSGNHQQAFHLLDHVGTEEQQRADIRERLARLTDDIPWDVLNLSFGEFFGEEPETFLTSVGIAMDVIHELQPLPDVPAVIHVGNYENLRVEYEGEEMIYYLLVQFEERILPWVHTVMFYNLFEDAGLAYLHDEFDEHREFLLRRLEEGEPVGYFPESSYWVAFDNSVPIWYPLYIRSRWTDIDEIRKAADAGGFEPLMDHVLFSTGWEWGYWANDAVTLRVNHTFEPWEDVVHELYRHHPHGEALAETTISMADLQHERVMLGRTAGYLAGRDAIIDFGKQTFGFISQPDRPSFPEVLAMTEAEQDEIVGPALAHLDALVESSRALHPGIEGGDLWVEEVQDGVESVIHRAEFIAAIYRALIHHARDGGDGGLLAEAETVLGHARQVVDRRHADLHDPRPERLLVYGHNPTIYHYGYLLRGDELCFWERELIQARNLIEGQSVQVPACALEEREPGVAVD